MFVCALETKTLALRLIRAVQSVFDWIWNKESKKVWDLFYSSATVLVCDPILITSDKSKTVRRTACESTIICGSVWKLSSITPVERASTSTSSRCHLINLTVKRVCYYCASPLMLILFHNLFTFSRALYYRLYIIFTWKIRIPTKKFPDFLQFKLSLLRTIVYLLNLTRAPEKQQRDTLLSNSLEMEGLGIYFAKETHQPHVTNSVVYIEDINFCGSQPCSPSPGQRFYGLIEMEHRTSVWKLTKILQFSSIEAIIWVLSSHRRIISMTCTVLSELN